MNVDAQQALESLTPGGSEFAGDPEACAEYVRRRVAGKEAIIKRMVRERQALAQELAAYRALLAGAPELLERAAKMAAEGRCSECPVHDECNPHLDEGWRTDHWLCNTAPAALRELAQGLRAFATVPEAGAVAEAGDRRGLAVAVGTREE